MVNEFKLDLILKSTVKYLSPCQILALSCNSPFLKKKHKNNFYWQLCLTPKNIINHKCVNLKNKNFYQQKYNVLIYI